MYFRENRYEFLKDNRQYSALQSDLSAIELKHLNLLPYISGFNYPEVLLKIK